MQKRHKVSKTPVMAWMLVNPQIHNIFASLGVQQGDAYKVNQDCLAILGDILSKLSVEDRTLRTFRRAIGFGQHIRKDLLPLLIHVKDDTKTKDATKIIDATIKILVNLTIPVECLLSMDALSKTDDGRHTIFEINKLLYSSKEAFIDSRSIKAVMDHMKFVIERGTILELEQCDSINNCLLLLRNILHIPENRMQISNCPLAHTSMQNRILWNLFTQSIDKLLLHLMSFPQKMYWVVTMVQLIALMYKDQHVGTLQKLLNLWFEASLSESSDDNESNTSPPNQESDSSPLLTSDPTSDSSDNGGSGKCNGNTKPNAGNDSTVKQHVVRSTQNRNKVLLTSQKHPQQQRPSDAESSASSLTTDSKKEDESLIHHHTMAAFDNISSYPNSFRAHKRKLSQAAHRTDHGHLSGAVSTASTSQSEGTSVVKKTGSQHLQSELSDYGYVTQVENQESISTSSNDDETPQQTPVHQKPHMVQKSRYNCNKPRNVSPQEKKELRRKKLIKRSKINIINMKGLMHHSPTDEDISNILKEFTVDFLLKGYGSLVHELYIQLLSNVHIQIDTSHFFWLVTYFLKFATQLELEFDLIEPVLSYNIISYLTYEGVNLCEQLEINSNQTGTDLKPCLRRMHLVVTAMREFLQAIETYKKITHLSKEDRERLLKLQIQIASTEHLKCLFLLLIRQYNPQIQSKQYLQDLLGTNHILLLFLDNTVKLPEYKACNSNDTMMLDHLKQFASVEVMHQYGLLLENFENNGKFTNDCIFTMMHHIGGDIDNIATLFQPRILRTFSKIWESDYEICDDWSDLIEYVIHKFINVPRHPSQHSVTPPTARERIGNIQFQSSTAPVKPPAKKEMEEWSEDDIDALYWYYVQSRKRENVIENIKKLYVENGITNKTRTGIIQQLLKQNIISQNYYEEYMKTENIGKNYAKQQCFSTEQESKEFKDIQVLKEQLVKENKGKAILWLQQILLETCHCKIIVNNDVDVRDGVVFEPVPYCFIKLNQSIPIVPYSKEHNTILQHPSFILLLHKLGFHLPADTRKLFIRIPNFWTADYMYSIAQKLGPIDPATLKFDINLLNHSENVESAVNEDILDVRIASTGDKAELVTPSTSKSPQFTSLPNSSSNWLQTVLHTKITAMLDLSQDITSSDALSITVPEVKPLPVNVSPSKISVVRQAIPELSTNIEELIPPSSTLTNSADNASVTNVGEQFPSVASDEFEHNSISDTASVVSDLTRMYVSDEEEKQ